MSLRKSISVFFILLSAGVFVFAQEQNEAAKLKQKQFGILIEQILTDAQNLKLGENRAILYAKTGNLVWKNDKKLALNLFQNAVGELINAQMQAESTQKKNNHNELLTGQQTRPQILQIIASRDGELTLDFLYKTRPAAISKALFYQAAKNNKISQSTENYAYLVQNEFNMEQSFIRLAADQNPERAVKLIKDSLKKGFSYETLNLLKKLFEKDPEIAAELAAELVFKLIQSKFIKDNQPVYQNLEIATLLLNDFNRQKQPSEKTLKFDQAQMRNLADSLISFYLEKAGQHNNLQTHSIIPIAEKLFPAKVEQLKNLSKDQSKNQRHGGVRNIYNEEINKVLSSETKPEQMVAEARKFPVSQRAEIYRSAANKFVSAGNLPAATQLLNDNFEDSALDNSLNSLNWYYAHQLINEGKFAEAENLMESFPEDSRVNSLISLATAIYQKDRKENKSYAVTILGKARAIVSERPQTSQEMSNLMQIIQAFAQIEPTEALHLYEPLIPQMNELSDAFAVINSFQGGGNIREGEFLLVNGDSYGFYGADFTVFQTFAKTDFDRTINLINTFSRNEIRLNLKLQLAGSLLN